MKNCVFISPNFPTNYWKFCRELRNNGLNVLGVGDLIHIEPGEVHYVKNAYGEPVRMVSTLAPYQETDKVNVDNPTY